MTFKVTSKANHPGILQRFLSTWWKKNLPVHLQVKAEVINKEVDDDDLFVQNAAFYQRRLFLLAFALALRGTFLLLLLDGQV